MIIIPEQFKTNQITAETIEKVISENLEEQISIKDCDIYTDNFEYNPENGVFVLKSILLKIEVDLAPESDEYDAELYFFQVDGENKEFNSEEEIEDFVDELIQNVFA